MEDKDKATITTTTVTTSVPTTSKSGILGFISHILAIDSPQGTAGWKSEFRGILLSTLTFLVTTLPTFPVTDNNQKFFFVVIVYVANQWITLLSGPKPVTTVTVTDAPVAKVEVK